MAAVASNHMPEDFRGPNPDQFAESGPSFTAVNGGTPPAAAPAPVMMPKSNQEPRRETVEEANPRPSRPSSQLERRLSPAPLRQPDRVQTHREQSEGPRYASNHSRTPSSQQARTATTSPQKRKRLFEEDYDDPNKSSFHNHGLPPSPERQRVYHDEGRERDVRDEQVQSRLEPVHGSTPADSSSRPPNKTSRIHDVPDHERKRSGYAPDQERQRSEYEDPPNHLGQPTRPYYNQQADPSDARLVEALRREPHNYASYTRRDEFGSPDGPMDEDDEHHAQHYGDYSTTRSSQSGVERDMKRRKRVFSNRTKTGCMTCRRRKKKCDEQHPECNNCLRGGFVCEGYTMRNTWQKPANAKAPIPLQSKNGYTDGPSRPPQVQPQYGQEISPEYNERPQLGQNQMMASEGDRIKPIVVDEERELSHSTGSPANAHIRPAYAKVVRPYPSNPPHISQYQPEFDHRMTSSIHDVQHDLSDPISMRPPVAQHRSNSNHSNHYPAHSSSSHNQQNPQAAAQAALQQSAVLRPSPSAHRRREKTEREKMLEGDYYFSYTPALTEDRERCLAAQWRFNNSTNPSNGVSSEERSRLFRAILKNRPNPEPPQANGAEVPVSTIPLPIGHVGEHVVVEAPFHCDYGYNINIGDDVLIGADCRFSDTCQIQIGARTILSPNVKLVCPTYPIDPRKRMGSLGQSLGRSIIIEEDCWIGSGVTILAGVRVGKSSTVGASSLIHKDVPPFTVVAGNPQKVSRGIYNGGNADGS